MLNKMKLYDVIRHIRPAFKHIAKSVETKTEQAGLTTGTRAVLEILVEKGPQTVPQLALDLLVERQYIQRNVNALLKIDLAQRHPNPAHKRSYFIEVTPTGRAQFLTLQQAEFAVLQSIGKTLQDHEITSAIKVMQTLSEGFSSLNQQTKKDVKQHD
jgi:DNA-binding MarR family transcriptional regulator